MHDLYGMGSWNGVVKYSENYVPLVVHQLKSFGLDIDRDGLRGDHLGMQMISSQEFDYYDKVIQSYATLVLDEMIGLRRNRIYRFEKKLDIAGIEILGMEIFEPKPDVELSKLKLGIEHIAFKVIDFDRLEKMLEKRNLPMGEVKEYSAGKFVKTKVINNVEIELRENFLVC